MIRLYEFTSQLIIWQLEIRANICNLFPYQKSLRGGKGRVIENCFLFLPFSPAIKSKEHERGSDEVKKFLVKQS